MKALGHMVSEKKIFYVFPEGGGISDPRGMFGRIYVKLHITMLHTKYRSFGCGGFREEDFFSCIFHCKPMADNDAPRVGPVWTPELQLARFIKRTTIHCYIQNMNALGLVVSDEKIFLCFSHDTPGAGPIWTPGAWLTGFIKRTNIHCYTHYCTHPHQKSLKKALKNPLNLTAISKILPMKILLKEH